MNAAATAQLGRIVVGGPAARQDLADRLAELDEVEKTYLATVSTTLLDPAMHEFRRRLRAGDLALVIEDGEVTWMTPEAFASRMVSRFDGRGA